MDPNNGELYKLPPELVNGPGTTVDREQLEEAARDRVATVEDLKRALERSPDAPDLVEVGEEVVQKLRLGERELKRRQRRRGKGIAGH